MSSNATDNNDYFYIKNTKILLLSRYNEYRTDQFNYFSKIHIYIIEKHRK
jgi:hypothetical protein